MSDSVRPHRRQPTRLPRPWDSPGKNTGVGCHFLRQCMKVKSESEVTQSCPTPSDPMDYSPPGPSIHGIFQARVLEWVAIAFTTHLTLVRLMVSSQSFLLFKPLWSTESFLNSFIRLLGHYPLTLRSLLSWKMSFPRYPFPNFQNLSMSINMVKGLWT